MPIATAPKTGVTGRNEAALTDPATTNVPMGSRVETIPRCAGKSGSEGEGRRCQEEQLRNRPRPVSVGTLIPYPQRRFTTGHHR